MVYKFRSLRESNLKIEIRDTDGAQVTVNFESINGSSGGKIGIFETEETQIAEAMLADERNGVVYMDADYLTRKAVAPVAPKPKKKKSTASARKTSATSEKPKKKSTKRKK